MNHVVCVLQGARGNDGAAGAAGPPVSLSLFYFTLCVTVFFSVLKIEIVKFNSNKCNKVRNL